MPVVALVDGDHHPSAVREALERVEAERGLAAVALCGGGEKLPAGPLDEVYGRPVAHDPEAALSEHAGRATAVVDLADEPALPATARMRLASLALHLGLRYEAPGLALDPPRYEPLDFAGPTLAVIGTGKRTGKTAVAGHWAGLLRDRDPVIVCMGRGGPAEPVVAGAGPSLADLEAVVAAGGHGASDYLEGAALAGVRTVGCRRVGGGPAGQPAASNVAAGARLAASLGPGAILLEGSGACVPPVEADRTVCVAGAGAVEPFAEYRLLRAELVLAAEDAPEEMSVRCSPDDVRRRSSRDVLRFRLECEPVDPPPAGARVALFTTGAATCAGVEPVVTSTALARREELAADLDRAERERCDLYLTELKAAAIDTVAARGVPVAFVRNRPVGIDADLDAALMKLVADA